MNTIFARISVVLSVLSGAAAVVLMLVVVSNVVLRKATGVSISGYLEISMLMLVAIVFLGLAGAEFRGEHIRVTLLTDRLNPRAASLVRAFAAALIVVTLAWLVYWSGMRAFDSYEAAERFEGIARIRMWPARVMAAAGLALMMIVAAVRCVQFLQVAAGRRPATDLEPEDDLHVGTSNAAS